MSRQLPNPKGAGTMSGVLTVQTKKYGAITTFDLLHEGRLIASLIKGILWTSKTLAVRSRLQHRHATFDEIATLSVEGMSKSAIARVKRIAWNTVHRWLERAGVWCRRFNDRKMKGLSVVEVQADEIKTIVGSKAAPIWIFAVIEVWSRLWPSTVIGKRSYQNTLSVFRNLSTRNESRTDSSGRHGWIWVLRESRQTSLWASVSLRSGDQDPPKRSHREGGAKSGAWR
jgi:hypothetical protein